MHHHHAPASESVSISSFLYSFHEIILVSPFLIAAVIYSSAIVLNNKSSQKNWPLYRTIFFLTGILAAAVSVFGPLAQFAHENFVAHMAAHLLLGMLAPLLIALSAPLTLILRVLTVDHARGVTSLLKSTFFRFARDPIFATILNMGGLWVLYSTNLFIYMHENILLFILIHFHLFLAGYLFTISIIYIDPNPHPTSYLYRAIVLVLGLAAHGILAKFIYANPLANIPQIEIEQGAMLMYYGGDVIDGVIVFILCLYWYRSARPRQKERITSYEALSSS